MLRNLEANGIDPRSIPIVIQKNKLDLPDVRDDDFADLQKPPRVRVVPAKAIQVLKWHVESQIVGPAMEESDLLFPSVHGTFRCPSVLNKPFADVGKALDLKKHLSQRCMRRTYNDLMRAAGINLAVLKSVSGHLTDDMVEHYSTISGEEQRASIGKVIDLMEAKAARQAKPPTEVTREAAP